MKRREFLSLGAAAGLGLALRSETRAGAPAGRPARRLLLVFCAGGWDTTYSIEPKPGTHADLPPGQVRRFEELDVFVDPSRPGVTALFERHAAQIAIVRGIATDGINHFECQRRMLTGTREPTRPDLGAIVAHDLGNDLPVPYLILGASAIPGPYAASAARVGSSNQIVDLLGDPAQGGAPGGLVENGPRPGSAAQQAAEAALIANYAAASAARERAQRGARGANRRRIDDYAASLSRAERLRGLRSRFGARGQLPGLAAQIPLALDALEQGLSQTVMLDTHLSWDTHTDNRTQGGMQDATFRDVLALVDELHRRPGLAAGTRMIDDTVVLVFSEMSRDPRLVGELGHEGKGHWLNTSAMVIGAGVRGGRTFGATTDDSGGMPIDLGTGAPSATGLQPLYSNFVAGMLRLCGADAEHYFPQLPVFDAFVG